MSVISGKSKHAKYCFRKCKFWDVDRIKYEERMYHTYTCMDDVPRDRAWENIENNNWFDIKLYDDVYPDDYLKVMRKLSEISMRKQFILHFSNAADEPLNDKVKSNFWKIITKFYAGKSIDLQFQHKIASGPKAKNSEEEYYVDTEFFDEIIEFCKNHKKIRLDRLSTLSVDLHEQHYYYLLDN